MGSGLLGFFLLKIGAVIHIDLNNRTDTDVG